MQISWCTEQAGPLEGSGTIRTGQWAETLGSHMPEGETAKRALNLTQVQSRAVVNSGEQGDAGSYHPLGLEVLDTATCLSGRSRKRCPAGLGMHKSFL